jgi:Domain of unknown function (DUF4145)
VSFKTLVVDMQGVAAHTIIQDVPDVCPICHRAVQPKQLGWYWLKERFLLQGVFQCVSLHCQNVFIGDYCSPNSTSTNWRLEGLAPSSPTPVAVPPEVAAISPTFVEIRNQVAAAEALKLDQLVGIGLRKALEFLIKDFAISEHASEKTQILQLSLGQCIDTYVPDGNIKKCAKRATWLGNDETHYLRKWETKDVNDLKALVTLTVNWIHSHLATKQFVGDMPEGTQ